MPTRHSRNGPGPPGDEKLKPGQERIRCSAASMRLSTEPDEVDDVADGVIEVTERYDGIVVSLRRQHPAGERGRATFDLRIPAQNLQATLADLSDLASVTERDEGSPDSRPRSSAPRSASTTPRPRSTPCSTSSPRPSRPTRSPRSAARSQVARAELAAARSELAT